jgi:uncharacterized protein involved in exopolysaccharide biosynthesis
MTEEINIPPEQPKKNNTVLYIVIGIAALCCICCGLALVAQLILQNSDFTLVNIIRPIF